MQNNCFKQKCLSLNSEDSTHQCEIIIYLIRRNFNNAIYSISKISFIRRFTSLDRAAFSPSISIYLSKSLNAAL